MGWDDFHLHELDIGDEGRTTPDVNWRSAMTFYPHNGDHYVRRNDAAGPVTVVED
jgi:hypothetical protein